MHNRPRGDRAAYYAAMFARRPSRALRGALCLYAAVLPVTSSPNQAGADELRRALDGLVAPAAAERFASERWLVANLDASDASALVDALAAPDAKPLGEEATWRLGRALGARSGNLGLALDLLTGALAPELAVGLAIEPRAGDETARGETAGWSLGRRLGRLALDQEIAGWRAGLDRPPVSGAALQLRLREERERHDWKRLAIKDGPVAKVLIQIAREGGLPVPLVLSQRLAERLLGERFGSSADARSAPFRGPWDRVLSDFARTHGLAWEAVLFHGDVDDEIAWLRLVPRGEEGLESGAAQLTRALEDLARRRSVGESEGLRSVSAAELQLAARFLANVEWDAASAWLADLWESEFDGMARAGLLEAAARGRVEARLASAVGIERLFKYARGLASGGEASAVHFDRLAAAFKRFPRFGADGSDLGEVFARGWRADWDAGDVDLCGLRLAGLEGTARPNAEGLALARTVFAETHARGREAWRALGVLALAGEPAKLGDRDALFALLPDDVAPDALARRLAAAGIQLALGPNEAAATSPAVLRTLFQTRLLSGDFEAAAGLLVGPSASGGLGFGESGSWVRSREVGRRGRSFDELCAALEGQLQRGELLGVRATLDAAARRALTAAAADAAPTDLSALTRGTELSALARLELLSGAMAPARQAALCAALLVDDDRSPIADDPEALAMLAASPVPGASDSRQRLLDLFAAALASPRRDVGIDVLPAIEHCLVALWARSADAEADALILDVATVAAGESQHPLAQEVLFRSWPPSPK